MTGPEKLHEDLDCARNSCWSPWSSNSKRSHLVSRKSYPIETKCQSPHLRRYTTFLEFAQTTCSPIRNLCSSFH